MRWYDDYLRRLYRSGRPNAFARLQNRLGAGLFAAGIWPRRVAALGVRGRRSGRIIWFPVVLTEFEGRRYIVSMLGPRTNWVRNLRAAQGRALLRHGRREQVELTEVAPERRAPILWQYLRVAPGARPHIPVGRDAAPAEYERIAPDYPVFRIDAPTG
ncbi:nitroreductase family deazaflavin-dependent oxidoreductase [Nocardia sp. CDC153]|uniref:nitroreductase family deazaflavin-dependent oxidoreductase n=1 Tax=Nocardia sp. CDC153 TaxID=3112167 RepID=UPI002DBF4B9C|nr:nitroreductase family deazaflavin-dependent oxidoreductase [Nocardia sp. CDC153]MEC3956666.1 nitroreductase family deazaflavin-dependent oxidoreductase [Nocardia sp. CDC153]